MENQEKEKFLKALGSDTRDIALYVHIPFCEKKCNYCSFVSFCDKSASFDRYIDCLRDELKHRSFNGYLVKSIFIGGGTPSVLEIEQLEKIFETIRKYYKLCENCEITIEANPNSLSYEKLIGYKQLGINRISIGVQSLSNKQLRFLGRLHDKKMALEMVKLASDIFENVNVDLIINLPNQSYFSIASEVKKLAKYVKHFSVYALSIEEGTKLYKMFERGELKLPNEEKCAKNYLKTSKFLQKMGFFRYEVSNFAKTGYQSRHNLVYWDMGEYLGVGVASHSFLMGERIANTENFDNYCTGVETGELQCEKSQLSKNQKIEETIMLSLRKATGLDLKKLNSDFGYDLLSQKKKEIFLLQNLGLVELENDFIKATDKGFLVLNQIILKLVDSL